MPNVDLASVSPAQAKQALVLASRTLEVEVARGMSIIRRGRGVVVLDAADLTTVGQVAAVAAVVTYDASRGATLQTWIRSQVRWWIRKTVNIGLEIARREAVIHDPSVAGVPDAFIDGLRVGFAEGWDVLTHIPDGRPNQEERLADEQVRVAVAKLAAETLSPREQVIMAKRLAGTEETDAAIAEDFGVDRTRVTRGFQSAVKKLTRALSGPRGVVAA